MFNEVQPHVEMEGIDPATMAELMGEMRIEDGYAREGMEIEDFYTMDERASYTLS
jgi:hypothetical protein